MTDDYINDSGSAGEMVRLDHQAQLVENATLLLPPLLENSEFQRILDIGCGPGHWTLEMAFDRNDTMVVGIDISRIMVDYANARAHSRSLSNVSFEEQDFLKKDLPFPEQSFDLIHVQFAVGWVRREMWLLLLTRCFTLLQPGGWLVITEGEGIYTNSLALERLHEILSAALFQSVYGLSQSPRFVGIVARLGSLLAQTGFHAIHIDASVLDYSHYKHEENVQWRHSFQSLIVEASPFFLKSGMTTIEELAQLDTQISIDMFQDDFCGIVPLFTFSAQKPEIQKQD
jgi:ubiquinone/menaquinone biosynthesis C-methylase UbiE